MLAPIAKVIVQLRDQGYAVGLVASTRVSAGVKRVQAGR